MNNTTLLLIAGGVGLYLYTQKSGAKGSTGARAPTGGSGGSTSPNYLGVGAKVLGGALQTGLTGWLRGSGSAVPASPSVPEPYQTENYPGEGESTEGGGGWSGPSIDTYDFTGEEW